MSQIDILAYLLASLLHDVGHPGLNNLYQQNKQTKLAMRYNDKSILENYHAYKGLRILNKSSSNILENLSQDEKKTFRKRFIGCIFATDMAIHTTVISKVSSKIEQIKDVIELEISKTINQEEDNKMISNENKIFENSSNNLNGFSLDNSIDEDSNLINISTSEKRIKKYFELDIGINSESNNSNNVNLTKVFDMQQDILNFLIHSSDVSNPSKDIKVYSIWTKLVVQEFFNQGDLERSENLPISYLCDRATTDVPKSQVGFINFIVMPLFKCMSFYFPALNYYEENVKKNLDYFKNVDNFDIEYEI